jgi:hypothetical protein
MVRIAALLVSPLLGAIAVTSLKKNQATPECWEALESADINGDGRVEASEYPLFLALYRPEVVSQQETFSGLPLALQSTFFTLACGCIDYGGLEDCCVGDNAHLPASEDAPVTQLLQVCYLTDDTFDSLTTISAGPTTSPVNVPQTGSVTPPPSSSALVFTAVEVTYTILVAGGKVNQVEYTDDLVHAMNRLGMDLQSDHFNNTSSQQESLPKSPTPIKRQSVIPIDAATTVIILVDDTKQFSKIPIVNSEGIYQGEGPCPADLGDPITDICAEVTHQVPVQAQTSLDGDQFRDELETAIDEGALQMWLEQIVPDSVVTILSGLSTSLVDTDHKGGALPPRSSTKDENDDDELTAGAKFGIVLAAFGVVGVVGFFLLKRQRQRSASPGKESDDYHAVESVSSDELEAGRAQTSLPTSPEGPIIQLQMTSPDASNPESESGWSSSQGKSSRGTTEEEQSSTLQHGTDVGTGAVVITSSTSQLDLNSTHMMDLQEMSSRYTQEEEEEEESQVDEGDFTTPMSELLLERAIIVGEWSAVGASAAILARSVMMDSDAGPDMSTDTSFASAQEEWNSRTDSQMVHDAVTVDELDKFIEDENWEAVVSAAAKFESEADDSSATTFELDDDDEDFLTTTTTFDAEGTVADTITTYATGATDDPTRAQIAALLEQVAPDELDSLNDMLEQFQGREDDLIETLKVMEQRHHSHMTPSVTNV